MSIMTKITWVFLLLICSTSRKSTLTCTTLWLVMAISTVRSQCIVIESKQHSSKSRIYEFSSTEKIWHFVVFICLRLFFSSVWFVCSCLPAICLHACLTVYQSICVFVCPSVWASICRLSKLSSSLYCVSERAVFMSVCLVFMFAWSAYMSAICLSVWQV